MKRGALAVAIGLHFVSQFLLIAILEMSTRAVEGLLPAIVLVLFAIGVLHVQLGARLETLAAED